MWNLKQGVDPVSESKSAVAQRVILKGLAAGALFSLTWVLSNHWFSHAWNRHPLGVYLLVFLASLLSAFILDRLEGAPWRVSYCIAFLFSFLFCFILFFSASDPFLHFLFDWYPSRDPHPDFPQMEYSVFDHSVLDIDSVFRITGICIMGKILTFVHTLFLRDLRLCLSKE